ncbi:pyrimidine/purine nucleoside phosphorylase [Shigella flexneri]
MKSIGFSAAALVAPAWVLWLKANTPYSTLSRKRWVIGWRAECVLPDATDWQVYEAGSVFNVPGHSEFDLQVAEPTSYLLPLSVIPRLPLEREEHSAEISSL